MIHESLLGSHGFYLCIWWFLFYDQAARQLEFFKGRNNSGPTTDALADALAIAQHHDAVSGTERQHVAADYALRISIGYEEVHTNLASDISYMNGNILKIICILY